MGDHKTNPRSIVKDILPPLLPPGCRAGVDIQPRVVPKVNVLLVGPDDFRFVDDDCEVFVNDKWEVVPEGTVVHPTDQPLPPELCDVVVMLRTLVAEPGSRGIVVPGQSPSGNVSALEFAELGRAPLLEWQARHLGALRGSEVG